MVATLMKVLCVIVVCMVATMPFTAEAGCFGVESFFRPCLEYLTKSGGTVPPACCDRLKELNNTAKTPRDRQYACNCVVDYYKATRNINHDNAVGISGKCGLSVSYSPTTDCTKVK